MKKFKSVVAASLAAAMIIGSFAACTNNGGSTTTDASSSAAPSSSADANQTEAPTDEPAVVGYDYTPVTSKDGKTLNIYTWNTEWLERLVDYYPGLVFPDDVTALPEGTADEQKAKTAAKVAAGQEAKVKLGELTVKFVTVTNTDNAYQDNLDDVLTKAGAGQEDADEEDVVDIFLVEADYALKYVDTDWTLAMSDLGLDNATFDGQYKYTKDVVTDCKGQLKGSSWQACPGAMIYRADVAEEVLGAKTPAEVQEYVKDWDTFYATAEKMADKGIHMVSSVDDTYRVFSNNVTSKWVVNGKLNIDANIDKWVDMSKKMYDANMCTAEGLWGDAWNNGFLVEGNPKVFSFFGPAWLVDFCMGAGNAGTIATAGGWRVTEGPQGFFWGGTWVCAANGTDNADIVADIIKTMTTDTAVLTKIIEEKSDFVNNDALIQKYATDEKFGDAVMGGQNPLTVFSKGVSSIDLSNLSAYDQGCNESFQNVIHDYCKGTYATKEDAYAAFKTEISTKYPDVKVD